jgi:Holliday junction resolvase RusA-like endonuclease
MHAQFQIPASWSQKKRLRAQSGLLHPEVTPDLDNIAKSILDGMEGIVYDNDKRVVAMSLTKSYGEPLVEVTVTEV